MMKLNAVAALFATTHADQLMKDSQGNGMRLLQDKELYGYIIPEDYWTTMGSKAKKDKKNDLDGKVAFKSHHGLFLRSDTKSRLMANKKKDYKSSKPDSWARFTPKSLGENRVAFENNKGLYMVCEYDGAANANRKAIGGWETWSVYMNDDCPLYKDQKDVVCLSFYNEANRKWLSAEENGDVNCNRDTAGAYEKWYFWDKKRIGQSKPNMEGRRWGDKDRKKDKKKDEKEGKKGEKERDGKKGDKDGKKDKKDKKKGGRDRKGKKGDWNFDSEAAIDFELENIGDVTLEYQNDFYTGRVDMPGDQNDITWNYRRSGAAALVASTMAAANIAMYLF